MTPTINIEAQIKYDLESLKQLLQPLIDKDMPGFEIVSFNAVNKYEGDQRDSWTVFNGLIVNLRKKSSGFTIRNNTQFGDH